MYLKMAYNLRYSHEYVVQCLVVREMNMRTGQILKVSDKKKKKRK